MNKFFKDLKVVELASVLAGPAVGMFFSELGADVTKIENKKTGGDMTRKWKLPSEDKNAPISAYYCSVNYKKKVLFKDFLNKSDYQEVLKLIEKADIVIANLPKSKAKKYKVDYNSLKAVNSEIIFANVVGYPNSEKPAFDLILQAETGFMSINGEKGRNPIKMPVALIDVLCAHQLKEGILLALIKKYKTGKGSYVEASLYESAVSSLVNQATNWLMAKSIPEKMGSLHPNIAPYGEIFTTKDNVEIVFAIGTDKQFCNLCKMINKSELCTSNKFSTNKNRVENREELYNILLKEVSKKTYHDIEEYCTNYNIPVGEIKTIDKVFNNDIAQKMVLSENIEKINTFRVKTVAFNIK